VTRRRVDTDCALTPRPESRHQSGLYSSARFVDVTGWLGGYNFHLGMGPAGVRRALPSKPREKHKALRDPFGPSLPPRAICCIRRELGTGTGDKKRTGKANGIFGPNHRSISVPRHLWHRHGHGRAWLLPKAVKARANNSSGPYKFDPDSNVGDPCRLERNRRLMIQGYHGLANPPISNKYCTRALQLACGAGEPSDSHIVAID